jgi:hypothetical protein
MIDIAHILDAPVPELGTLTLSTRPTHGARVQQALQDYLAGLQNQSDLSDWLSQFRQHLIDITDRWGDDLFVCYDIAGVPPTNNALESRFGRLRRDQRRISGRQFNTATLLMKVPTSSGNVATVKRKYYPAYGGWPRIARTINGALILSVRNKNDDD